jgi:hypothetical protein
MKMFPSTKTDVTENIIKKAGGVSGKKTWAKKGKHITAKTSINSLLFKFNNLPLSR